MIEIVATPNAFFYSTYLVVYVWKYVCAYLFCYVFPYL